MWAAGQRVSCWPTGHSEAFDATNMNEATPDNDEYFNYLKTRSRLGGLYRKYWLYPRLSKRLLGRALDVGCGIGDMLVFRKNTVGVDINPRTVQFCIQRGVQAHLMAVNELPFEEGEFDSVLLDNVLEHIARPQPLIAEVHRVLAPGGRLVAGVPGLKGWHSDPDHKIKYDEVSLVQTIQALGFSHLETFNTPLWRSQRLDRSMRQYCIYAVFDRSR